jgi:hypothetical protein
VAAVVAVEAEAPWVQAEATEVVVAAVAPFAVAP